MSRGRHLGQKVWRHCRSQQLGLFEKKFTIAAGNPPGFIERPLEREARLSRVKGGLTRAIRSRAAARTAGSDLSACASAPASRSSVMNAV